VRASRFGGEGTGGHSDFDFAWKTGDTTQETKLKEVIQRPDGESAPPEVPQMDSEK
jgi:hypothetical protein